MKGGSDTTTKLIMDNCAVYLPRANCETVASTRCIMLLYVLVHCLFQLISSNPDLNKYASLYHYRKAATKHTTFHHTLLHCNKMFVSALKEMEEERENETRSSNVSKKGKNMNPLFEQRQRVMPDRRMHEGVYAEEVNFPPSLPFLTPKKISQNILNGEAPFLVQEMVSKCTGMPLKAHKGIEKRVIFVL